MRQRRIKNRNLKKTGHRKKPEAARSTPSKVARAGLSVADLKKLLKYQARELEEVQQQQAASSEVLHIIGASEGALTPIFRAIVKSAVDLCRARFGAVFQMEGDLLHLVTDYNFGSTQRQLLGAMYPMVPNRGHISGRAILSRVAVQIPDIYADDDYKSVEAKKAGFRSLLAVPLLQGRRAIGSIVIYKTEPGAFTIQQSELLQTFAAQAVIAIENARLFNELQAKTVDLQESLQQQTATSEVLRVISSSSGDLQPVFKAMLANALKICEATFGNLLLFDGNGFEAVELHNSPAAYAALFKSGPLVPSSATALGRVVATKRVVHIPDILAESGEVERNPLRVATIEILGARTLLAVPMLREDELVGAIVIYRQQARAFSEKQIEIVSNFADQAVIAIENARLLNELRVRTQELSQSLDDLRAAQDRLVQTEKLASLGQLTAGIAHEIKNPLNFVNNFSGMSTELVGELLDIVTNLSIDADTHADIKELTEMLRANLEKIVQHGKRADAIVKSMLLHSGQSSGEHRLSDINALVDESLNRAYYGERAETRGFTIKLEKSFDPAVGEVDLFPREISRALLNLISNGFYATTRRKEIEGGDYEPALLAATRNLGDRVEIRIRDNGHGIPAEVREKMFDPFFTTKPAGEGTGLGLSITHDIIVKQHGGSIEVDTKPGEFAEIRLTLPRTGALLPERR